jgi:hypothetical protein
MKKEMKEKKDKRNHVEIKILTIHNSQLTSSAVNKTCLSSTKAQHYHLRTDSLLNLVAIYLHKAIHANHDIAED